MQFKKDFLKVFISNFINLILSIINGFVIPAFLPLNQYALLKTFTLYTSYVGVLHFGFLDGLYIKYGGKQTDELDKKLLLGEHNFLLIFQLIVAFIISVVGLIIDDKILIALSIAILPINLQNFFKLLYQSLGEFNKYSKIVIIYSIVTLVINILIIFLIKINTFWSFVVGNLFTYYLVFIGLEFIFFKEFKGINSRICIKGLLNNFKVGSFIMVGNLSSILFYAIDRWFVKFTMSMKDFAYYSFSISMLTVINILINSVTMTFYPYFAREQDVEKLKFIKKILLIVGFFSSGGYFVFEFIINLFLKKYIPSLDIISILFVGYPAIIIINALYLNLYKATKRERLYFFTVLSMCLLSIILNIFAIVINKTNVSVALATTISFYLWLLYSIKDFPYLKYNLKEILYITLCILNFVICNKIFSPLVSLLIYFALIYLFTYLLFRRELITLIKHFLHYR